MHANRKCIVITCTHQLVRANNTKKHVVFFDNNYTFVVTADFKVNYRMGWGDGGITPPNP